jgi:spermidine/putrescine transport system substrate-binding protein
MFRFTKKAIVILTALAAALGGIISLAIVTYTPRSSVLKIYNWADYIDADLITEFEKTYREKTADPKFKVQYDIFTDNEELYTKIDVQKMDYDIAFPSEYMVEKLLAKNLLSAIDSGRITHYGDWGYFDEDIFARTDGFAKKGASLYAVPYMYGTLGIMYDTGVINAMGIDADEFEAALPIAGWGALWGETVHIPPPLLGEDFMPFSFAAFDGRITMKKSARDTIAAAMLYSHQGDTDYYANIQKILNAESPYSLDTAKTALEAQITKMHPTYENDEGKQSFANPDDMSFAFGLYWSCDGGLVMDNNPNIKFYVPDGTNLWMDNFVMPKFGKNQDAAYAFINFMLEAENAKQNMEYVGSACPVVDAMNAVKVELAEDENAVYDEDSGAYISGDMYVDTIIPTAEMVEHSAVMKNFDDRTENEVNSLMIYIISKSALDSNNNADRLWLWVALGAAGACGIAWFIWRFPQRRRKRL